MFRTRRPRAALAAAALALALLAPPASRAEPDSPSPSGSPIGVVFAVLCGAGANLARMVPGEPIVVVVTAVACLGMYLDAFASPDP